MGVVLAKGKEYVLYMNEPNMSRVWMIYGGRGCVLTKERKSVGCFDYVCTKGFITSRYLHT